MICIAICDSLLRFVIDGNDYVRIKLFNAWLCRRCGEMPGRFVGQLIHVQIMLTHGNRLSIRRKNAVDVFISLSDRMHGPVEAVQSNKFKSRFLDLAERSMEGMATAAWLEQQQ